MASTNFEAVLGALRSLTHSKLSGLEANYLKQRQWVQGLAIGSAQLEPSPEAAAKSKAGCETTGADAAQEKENVESTRKGRGRGKRPAAAAKPPARKGTARTRRGATDNEEVAEGQTLLTAEDQQQDSHAPAGSRAVLDTVPEADETSSPPEPAEQADREEVKCPAALTPECQSMAAEGLQSSEEDVAADGHTVVAAEAVQTHEQMLSGSREVPETEACESRRSGDSNTSDTTANNNMSTGDAEAEKEVDVKEADIQEPAQQSGIEAVASTPLVSRVAQAADATHKSPCVAGTSGMMTPKVSTGNGVSAETAGRRAPVPKSTMRKRSLLDDTPLAQINQQLRTASKTVSCRKKRPKTPHALSFAIPSTINPLFGPTTSEAQAQPEDQQDSLVGVKHGTPSLSHSSPQRPAQSAAAAEAPETIYKEALAGSEAGTPQPSKVVPEGPQDDPAEMEIDAVPDTPANNTAADASDPCGREEFLTPSKETSEPIAEPEPEQVAPCEVKPEASQPGGQEVAAPEEAAATAPAAKEAPIEDPEADGGAAPARGNILSTVMSFIPMVKASQQMAPPPAAGKSQVKVKALEAANAARKEAEAKQEERKRRLEAAKQRREAARAAQTTSSSVAGPSGGQHTRGPAMASAAGASKPAGKMVQVPSRLGPHAAKAEQRPVGKTEANNRAAEAEARRAKEEQERKERQERVKRMAQTATKIRQDGQHLSRTTGEAKPLAQPPSSTAAAAKPSVTGPAKPAPTPDPVAPVALTSQKTPTIAALQAAGTAENYTSYEISPYKSSSDEESDSEDTRRGPRKPIPQWASSANLAKVLQGQQHLDPDEIFQQKHIKTCNLDAMFRSNPAPKRPYSRRGSSGNWIEDRVTWQEELAYKKAMGFRAFA